MDKSDYYVFFSYAVGIGPKTFLRLLSRFDSAEKIYNASEKELEVAGLKGKRLDSYLSFKLEFDIGKVLEELEKKNVWVLTYKDFPKSLRNISNPPIVLFGRGDKDLIFSNRNIGVVGSRRPTGYGISVTKSFVKDFVEEGFTIVSGMALGIDAVAHRESLRNQGRTIAVMGSGVDLPTPAENSLLYNQIIENGGAVVSEYPLGTAANKGSFPARNRIISALSQAILIPEAASDSGALITAKEAFSQKRKVFVVPGPITSSLSKGTNSLLSKGGIAVGSVNDISDNLDFGVRKTREKIIPNLNKDDMRIYKSIENENMTADMISRKLKIPIGKIITVLSELELQGMVINNDGKWSIKS